MELVFCLQKYNREFYLETLRYHQPHLLNLRDLLHYRLMHMQIYLVHLNE